MGRQLTDVPETRRTFISNWPHLTAGFEEKDKEMKERQREKYDWQYRVHPIYSNMAR